MATPALPNTWDMRHHLQATYLIMNINERSSIADSPRSEHLLELLSAIKQSQATLRSSGSSKSQGKIERLINTINRRLDAS